MSKFDNDLTSVNSIAGFLANEIIMQEATGGPRLVTLDACTPDGPTTILVLYRNQAITITVQLQQQIG